MMSPSVRQLSRYALAVISVATSVATVGVLNVVVDPFAVTGAAFLLVFVAVLWSVWYAGVGPGMVATVLGAALAHYYFVEPTDTILKPGGRNLYLLLFLAEGGLICYLTESLRRAQNEAKTIGNEYRLLVDGTMNHSIVMLDNMGRIKSWNHGARRVLGYSTAEILEQHYSVLFTAEDEKELPNQLLEQVSLLGRIEIEGFRVRKDGSQFWAAMAITALRSTRGQVTGFVLVTFDVTDRWRAESALRENERRLQLMSDALPVLIAYIDSEGRYRFNNATYERWFGVAPEACRGRLAQDVLGPEAFNVIKSRIASVLRGEEQGYETLMPCPLGGPRYVHVDCIPHRTTEGKIPGFYLLIVDISDQKRIEDALRTSEDRLRAIVTTAADAIITLDRRGMIASVNLATEKMFGYSAGEMVGQNIGLFLPFPHLLADSRSAEESARSIMRRLIRSGREIHANRKDGSTFPVEISVSETGSLGLFTGILRDVSERMTLEREVLEATAQEQRRIGQELHDHVGQELTGLGLLIDTLSELVRNDRPIEEERVHRIADRLRKLHADVRALAHGLLPVSIHPNGLREALSQLAKSVAETSRLQCRLQAEDTVHIADTATATHLFRIAQEAVSNAIRHGKAEQIEIRLRVERPRTLLLDVRDNGVGIEETPERNDGMGLKLMEYRASLIGGNLTVESAHDSGRGTIVSCRVLLPAKQRSHTIKT